MAIPIWENKLLTTTKVIELSWRERLLSWPWRPWRSTKTIQVPSTDVFKVKLLGLFEGSHEVLVAHPVTAARIRKEVGSGW